MYSKKDVSHLFKKLNRWIGDDEVSLVTFYALHFSLKEKKRIMFIIYTGFVLISINDVFYSDVFLWPFPIMSLSKHYGEATRSIRWLALVVAPISNSGTLILRFWISVNLATVLAHLVTL